MRRSVSAWCALLFIAGSAMAAVPSLIPERADVFPEFSVPRENSRALDENWVFVQSLYDASPSLPQYWGAVPVGFAKAPQGRAFIATLHTVFRTVDAGRTWTNLDPQPAPTPSPTFSTLRSPNFLSDITWRPVSRPDLNLDSLYLTVYNSSANSGVVRLIRGFGTSHVLWPDTVQPMLHAPRWLTCIAAPDSHIAVAIAGLDARIYRNDSMHVSSVWDTLPEHFSGSWVTNITTVGNFIYAVGSEQWLSLDRGYSWQTLPPADPLGDIDLDFAGNGPHGIVCGGQDNTSAGWARYTDDFGQSWSERTLQADVPLRSVLMINDTLGYVAGGIANNGIGKVWRTNDGGHTWNLELQVDAEINELGFTRESGGYINVIAAGFFADFRGGVWRSHVMIPDTSGPALVFSQDTLEFFAAAGQTVVHDVTLKNVGGAGISVTNVIEAGPFLSNCCTQDVLLLPGDSMVVSVTFAPGIDGDFTNNLRVINDHSEFLELVVHGSTLTEASPRVIMPQEISLSVYPNPGNAEFQLSYMLARNSDVRLTLFDVTGREVAVLVDATRVAGEHVVNWNASAQASGVYFAVLNAGDVRRVSKIVLMK